MYFSDSSQMWTGGAGAIPRSAGDAEAAARRFMEEANRRVAASHLRDLAGIALFPADPQLASVGPMFAEGRASPDHWLCTFGAELSTGLPNKSDTSGSVDQTIASVMDAGVDIRVGANSSVIGMWSTWRPVRGFEMVDALRPPPGGATPSIIYQAYGHDIPQDLLAPYYLMPGDDEDTGALLPASSYSLLVDIGRDDGASTTQLTAQVTGNVGSLAYAWGAWPLEVGPVAGLTSLGTGATVQLEAGAYNVVLDVQDQLTGAFVRKAFVIYFGDAALGVGG